jgi:hypothetical protein
MEPNTIDKGQQLTLDERLKSWTYPSAAASGHVEVELPSLPGSPYPTERLHARDFGRHVAGKIESTLKRNPYLKSGPQQSPAEVLGHYVATARGAKLMDEKTLAYMGRLSKEFAAEKGESRQTYFESMVRPFLNGLKPERRKL